MKEEIVQALAEAAGMKLSQERIKQITPLLSGQLQSLQQLRPLGLTEEPVCLFKITK
ncbi:MULTISPECIES: hypothetical protein [unclassified Paenibacillus]|uniref:hypothetical protein n=1 Tax=unclassified Paenibacillus TaxID=185978 RepID=UPI002406611C|nr:MULTISPECIES: hypothetical protein [unclassified Paenibacillus]MDF9839394.1 hypothetical protein [Paenibacillus sp. PastF-2]MDF9845974.1 hypothetical protein [Paenibacillus sp. PastM-2]MDF9852547.1 hypothetical protein [Paenibacillus sp. PastF-1]MDH6477723.1 hypothetical protein [Paenibacillus sp. PastH-2]MDH6505462.1 hypothetical protein [Paenibacillus sp. PastM-3]